MNAQSSIRSFFQAKAPSDTTTRLSPATTSSLPPAPPPSSTRPPPPTAKYIPAPGKPPSPTAPPSTKATETTPTSHPNATLSRITEDHIQPLRRINSLLLPISYPDNFYNATTSPSTNPNFSRVILWSDTTNASTPSAPPPKVIGGIICRLDLDPSTQICSIYVQSLGILAPYRNHGLATNLLNEVIKHSMQQKVEPCPITSLYVHVWTSNEEAIKWYEGRGFKKEGDVIPGYYRRLQPDSAVLMRRVITVEDHLEHSNTASKSISMSASSTTLSTAPSSSSTRPPPTRAVSYQQKGPDHEWNDLPSDILQPSSRSGTGTHTPRLSSRPSPNASATSLLAPPSTNGDVSDGGGSSRSSSMTREGGVGLQSANGQVRSKKKRVYPAAAFGQ